MAEPKPSKPPTTEEEARALEAEIAGLGEKLVRDGKVKKPDPKHRKK